MWRIASRSVESTTRRGLGSGGNGICCFQRNIYLSLIALPSRCTPMIVQTFSSPSRSPQSTVKLCYLVQRSVILVADSKEVSHHTVCEIHTNTHTHTHTHTYIHTYARMMMCTDLKLCGDKITETSET